MTTPTTCPVCGQPHRMFDQDSILPGKPVIHMADCQNRDCYLYAVTLEVGAHALLTPAELDAYRAARRPATVAVVHPLTGETVHLHPSVVGSGVWLPPNPDDLTDATIAELRAHFDIPYLASAIGRLARETQANPITA